MDKIAWGRISSHSVCSFSTMVPWADLSIQEYLLAILNVREMIKLIYLIIHAILFLTHVVRTLTPSAQEYVPDYDS